MRFLFVKRGCKACLEFKRIIPRINMLLPIELRIRILENWEYEVFGVKIHLIQERLTSEEFTDYPLLYLDGIIYTGGQAANIINSFLRTYLKDDTFIET